MSSRPPKESSNEQAKALERKFDELARRFGELEKQANAPVRAGVGEGGEPPPPRCAISDQPVAGILDIVFKLGDNVNKLWTFLLLISGAAAGWSFSHSGNWDGGQRALATVLYLLFILVNGCAMFRMYRWLKTAMDDLRDATRNPDEQGPKLSVAMSRIKPPGGEVLPYIVYVLVTGSVVASIWYPQLKDWVGF